MNIAVKRIHSDICDYMQSKSLNEQGVFCTFDDDNLFHVRAMIVGPEDTPYAYGFYFFDLRFPKDYPFKPPQVSYETRSRNIRFHPNLYASSKVCLSILGTWSGPGWTSAQTLSSVLLTIQSLLTADPLTNEPGYQVRKSQTETRHKNYETMVTFENYRTAIGHMMSTPPNGFEAFLPIMHQCFVTNIAGIEKQLSINYAKEPKPSKMRCGVYNFETLVDYASCTSHIQAIKNMLVSDVPSTDSISNSATVEDDVDDEKMQVDCMAKKPESQQQSVATGAPSTNKQKPAARVKKPKRKACEVDMQGQILTVEQGPNKPSIQFQSRKCKQKDVSQPEKWQWRKIKQHT